MVKRSEPHQVTVAGSVQDSNVIAGDGNLILQIFAAEKQDPVAQVLRLVLATQYAEDALVKFKQVNLDSQRIQDLFVDVPLESMKSDDWERPRAEEDLGGGARFVMSDAVRLLAIFGGPGQGKSTLLQFACQIHRAKILDIPEFLQDVDQALLPKVAIAPIRIELRDLDAWLRGKDPFDPDEASVPDEERTFEAFVCRLFRLRSGGLDFQVLQLHQLVRTTPVLFALDGLDEIADVSHREGLVVALGAALQRFESLTKRAERQFRVILTTRPSAQAGDRVVPAEFRRVRLKSIPPSQADEYVDRWIRLRKLSNEDVVELRAVYQAKRIEPHVQSLLQTPMQLAILLHLMHTKGHSLPDQRTRLYRGYVEQFFDRESTKSSAVREHRQVLEDFHGYLGWRLHADAESKGGTGRIAEEQIKAVLRNFLVQAGKSPDSLQQIFAGVVERILMLESRIQGFFEFEVQPIREFFAAKHLFETSPVAVVGTDRRGDRAERIETILPRPYWLNVARFYCGFFHSGELSDLADLVRSCTEGDTFELTAHPRVVAGVLLQDWVFAQRPTAAERVAACQLDELGLRLLNHSQALRDVLPSSPGRGLPEAHRHLRQLAVDEDAGSTLMIDVGRAFGFLRAQTGGDEGSQDWWRTVWRESPTVDLAWLGAYAGFLRAPDVVDGSLPDWLTQDLGARLCLVSSAWIDPDSSLAQSAWSLLRNGDAGDLVSDTKASSFHALAGAIEASFIGQRARLRWLPQDASSISPLMDPSLLQALSTGRVDATLRAMAAVLGDCWSLRRMHVAALAEVNAAGGAARTHLPIRLDDAAVERARSGWWEQQRNSGAGQLDHAHWLLAFRTFASEAVFTDQLDGFAETAASLDPWLLDRVFAAFDRHNPLRRHTLEIEHFLRGVRQSIPLLTALAFAGRMDRPTRNRIVGGLDLDAPATYELPPAGAVVLLRLLRESSKSDKWLTFARHYGRDVTSQLPEEIDLAVVKMILRAPQDWNSTLVCDAENARAQRLRFRPVSNLAEERGWVLEPT